MQSQSHLIIIGGGSAAFAGARKALELGARVTLCNRGLPMGGTCLNVGCVPSKTLIRAAEAYHRGRHTGFRGLKLHAQLVSFRDIVQQKRDLIDQLRASNYEEALPALPGLRYLTERGTLEGPGRVRIGSERMKGDRVLIATGTSPLIPELEGLSDLPYLTNASAFELERLPESMIVLGGGYIALECAQMFARFGTRVTVLQRSAHILSEQPRYLGEALRRYLEQEDIAVVCGVTLERAARQDAGVAIQTRVAGERRTFSAEQVLVATGRKANTEGLADPAVGLRLTADGFVEVNDLLETSVPGVYAAGDVIGDPQYVYTASYEAEVAVHNALTGHPAAPDYTALPWVIFTDPQVAGVGYDDDQARARGFATETATLDAACWPRLKVARDTRGFIKLIRDRATDQLLGARILAPEGGDLVTELGLAIRHGITVTELANTFHPYLTLSEGIQRAAQRFNSART